MSQITTFDNNNYQVTATATGTTTLTNATYGQIFTGTMTQICVLPNATTYSFIGGTLEINNRSSALVTVNYNGGSLALTLSPGILVKCILTDNTTSAGTWTFQFFGQNILSKTLTTPLSSTTSLPSGGAAVSGLAITLTPATANSKFLLSSVLQIGSPVTCYAWFASGSTAIGTGTPSGSRLGIGTKPYPPNSDNNMVGAMQYLHSPATTSSLTYNVYIATDNTFTVYLNQTANDANNTGNGARLSSTLSVTEIF